MTFSNYFALFSLAILGGPGLFAGQHGQSPSRGEKSRTALPAEQWTEIDDTIGSINSSVERMVGFCQQRCSLWDDVTGRCFTNCMQDYSEQIEHFLQRKYTRQCLGQPFKERFQYRDSAREQLEALIKTNEAVAQWSDPRIAACAQAKLREHERIAQSALRIARSEVNDIKLQLPPVVNKTVETYYRVRHGSDPSDRK